MLRSLPRDFLPLSLLFLTLTMPFGLARADDDDDDDKTVAEVVDGHDAFEGLFTLFRDPKSGVTHMRIEPTQLGQEFIHWVQVANGAATSGFFKGKYGSARIVELRRHFDRIEFYAKNTGYVFDPDSALSRASQANLPDALLAVADIVAEDPSTGAVLIDAAPVFASESLTQITPTANPDADPKTTLSLGSLDKDKTRILNLRSYAENTDIEVAFAFHNGEPLFRGQTDVTDPRHVSARVMHSLIAVPDNDYQARPDDARMGYFSNTITELTSHDVTPYRDQIHRWHLVKKDPTAAVSEPIEPIVWWIENTTPVEWRGIIRDAALEWNRAFETAGFRNALEVRIQPDDATWDAGDIRYNVLRWTSSPFPPFGGYGPHFSNPRTGQILGADIMLEFSMLGRYKHTRPLLQPSAVGVDDAQPSHCAMGSVLHDNHRFSLALTEALGNDDALTEQLVRDTLHYLILHEIGHTLGLSHNMKASNLLSLEEAFNADIVAERGLAGSVMDYPAVNFASDPRQQTLFYSVRPGPYDHWAIDYGYSQALDDSREERARLAAILARSTEPALIFGNDADDMRRPGAAMDPRVNVFDMASDSIAYAVHIMELMQRAMHNVDKLALEEGRSYQGVRNGLADFLVQWRRAASTVSRFVGGVYVDRSVVGQADSTSPFTPVSEETQRQAMDVLTQYVFAPGAMTAPPSVYRMAAAQRRGFAHYGTTEDHKVQANVLAVQKAALDGLLHPVVLERITDTTRYGNTYTLDAVLSDLTRAVFAADAKRDVDPIRQNLQLETLHRLIQLFQGDAIFTTRTAALAQLLAIDKMLGKKGHTDAQTQAHTAHIKLMIRRALDG